MENNTLAGYIITIDGGTTNTRCILWDQSRNKIAEEKRQVGVRNTAIDGNNEKLKMAVKESLDALLDKNDLTYENIRRIIASGMITSDVGIVVIPHLSAPAGLDDLARATVAVDLPKICPIPVHFIPGIKNAVDHISVENYEAMDIMRGEEVESIALMDRFFDGSPMPVSYTHLAYDSPEKIIQLIKKYPRFKEMYDEIYVICRNVERVMGMFSKELQELDRNTVQYMIDDMQEEINKQSDTIDSLKRVVEEQKKLLEQSGIVVDLI